MTVASRRRGDRASSALDVAAAAEERVDAVTVEPLVPDRHVEIVSPDGTLRLFYNTSTLIRIALDHGGWLQPPHFREPMTASLQRRIEHLEGRRFRFEAVDRHARTRSSSGVHEGAVVIVDDVGHRSDGTSDGGPWRSAYAPPTMTQQHTTAAAGGDAGSSGGVLHRHVFFEQIISRFYFLNQAEVYVCPVCYAHYVSTRYVPALRQRGRRVEYVDDGHTAVVDPLDVLTHMQHVELRDARDGVPSNSNNDSGDNNRDNRDDGSRGRRRRSRSIRSSSSSSSSHDADGRGDEGSGADDDDDDDVALASRSALVCVVFRRAQQWRRHMRVHHAVHAVSSNDYRLRDVLCSYHNAYNQLHEEAFVARVAAVGEAQPRAALTQQRYWQLNARYNVLRYNRVVAAVERAERATTAAAAAAAGTACIERCAFDDEAMTSSFAAATDEGDDDDDGFIVNDSDSGSASSSSSSSSSSSAASREDGHADEDDVHGSDADTSSAAAAAADGDDDDGRRTSVAREHRRRRRQRDDDNSSSSSSTITSTDSDSDDSDGGVRMLSASSLPRRGGRCAVSQLYKQGLLAPTPSYMQRMSAEDRAFVERAAHRRVAASQLYDPVMHRDRRERRGGGGGAVSALLQRSAEDVDDDEDDDKAHEDDVDWDCIGGTLSLTRAQRVATRPPHEPRRTCVPRTTDTAPTVTTADTDAAAAVAAAAHTPPRLLLLDDASDMDGDASDKVTATTTTTAAAPSSSTRMTTAVTTYTTRLLTDEDDVM